MKKPKRESWTHHQVYLQRDRVVPTAIPCRSLNPRQEGEPGHNYCHLDILRVATIRRKKGEGELIFRLRPAWNPNTGWRGLDVQELQALYERLEELIRRSPFLDSIASPPVDNAPIYELSFHCVGGPGFISTAMKLIRTVLNVLKVDKDFQPQLEQVSTDLVNYRGKWMTSLECEMVRAGLKKFAAVRDRRSMVEGVEG